MKVILAFEVMGKPVPLGRPRINMKAVARWMKAKGKGNPWRFGPLVYTPSDSAKYQRVIRKACPNVKFPPSYSGVTVRIIISRPQPKTLTPQALRPDIDNIEKTVLDALAGVAFDDDSNVSMLVTKRIWNDGEPYLGIQVEGDLLMPQIMEVDRENHSVTKLGDVVWVRRRGMRLDEALQDARERAG